MSNTNTNTNAVVVIGALSNRDIAIELTQLARGALSTEQIERQRQLKLEKERRSMKFDD